MEGTMTTSQTYELQNCKSINPNAIPNSKPQFQTNPNPNSNCNPTLFRTLDIDCGFFMICNSSNMKHKKQLVDFWEQQRRISEKIRDEYDASVEEKYIRSLQNNKEASIQNVTTSIYKRLLNSVIFEESQSICFNLLNYSGKFGNKLNNIFFFLSSQPLFPQNGNTFYSDFSLFSSCAKRHSKYL